MGDAQSAQRDGCEPEAEEQSAVEHGPSGESAHDKNNGQISEFNSKPDGTTADARVPCEEQFAKEEISVTGSAPEVVTNVQIIQEEIEEANDETPIEIINMDDKQNDLNESFRRFFSNIGLKLTVKKGSGDQAEDEAENKEIEKLEALEETANDTNNDDVEHATDLNIVQDNDSTTCPTLTEGTSDDVPAVTEEKITETKEIADNAEGQETNVTADEQEGSKNHNATLEQFPTTQEEEEEEIVSPIKKFFTTGIFAGLKKKKIEDETEDKELVDMSKNGTDGTVVWQETVEASPNIVEQDIECKEVQEDTVQAIEPPEVEVRGKSPSTDQDSESEITSSLEKVQSSPLKRLFSGTTFKKRSKRRKKRSSERKLSDSGEQIESQIVASSEKTEKHDMVVETPSPPPLTTDPDEELSAWEAFKKLMTPKKSLKRASIGSEEAQVQGVAVEETKLSDGERISDQSTEERRKRKDSSHSWEAVLCGSGRRRSRKTSDSEDEQKQVAGEGGSSNDTGDVVTSTPKQADSPSDSESSTWKSFKKLLTPKRKVEKRGDDEESKDIVQSDSEATQEETLFSIKKLLPGRKRGNSGGKLSSDEGDKEIVSMEEDSETPAVVPLSEFDKSETEEVAKSEEQEVEKQGSDLESEQEHVLEIPKTFVQEVQEHQVTPIIPLNQDQDELTEFSKYQPLSDIPEEGNVTETVATSLIEDVAKDDTIADDMVELTSEAITAPEPVDLTMGDETDDVMLSAASHLTESSKTSGNSTPVPIECEAKDTEVLLKEVVETISTTTKANTICSEKPASEIVVGSVTHEMFERSAIEEQNVMEAGLEIDQINDTDVEIQAQVLSENLSEFKDAISTEYVSGVSKVEFESAKTDVDEVHVAQPKRAVKQESVDDSDYMIESLSEVPEYVDVETDLVADKTESEDGQLITAEPLTPKDEVDSIEEIVNKEEVGSAEIDKSVQPDTTEAEKICALAVSLEGTPEMDEEISNEQAPGEIHEVANVEVKSVSEDDFEIDFKPDAEDIQEPTIESQTLSEISVEEVVREETVPVADLVTEEEIIANAEAIEEPGPESQEQPDDVVSEIAILQEEAPNSLLDKTCEEEHTGQIMPSSDQEIVEQISEAFTEQAQQDDIGELGDKPIPDVAANELLEETVEEEVVKQVMPSRDQELLEQTIEEVSTEAAQQDDMGEMKDTSHLEVAADKLVEETFEDELIHQSMPSHDQEIVEQTTEEVYTEVAQLDDIGELRDTQLPEVAANEIDDKVLETIEYQQREIALEDEINIQISSAEECESEAISQLGDSLFVNGGHSEAKPSEAQIMQVDHLHEVVEDLEALPVEHVSSIHEDSGIAQVLEETINMEKSSGIFVSTTEEPIHEVYIGEMEVNVEEQSEEEIPCPDTDVAEVEHAALQEESLATLQQVTATTPDLTIQNKLEDSGIESSIPCVDNAEVLDEPKHEVQLTEVNQVGIQEVKEEEVVQPEMANVDVQHTLVAQMTTCHFKDVASSLPDVSTEITTSIHEPILSMIVNEQQVLEAIETTTPLGVNNVTQAVEEEAPVVPMHVPSVEFEDSHQVQVKVVDTDVQSAEARLDTALEIGVQEDKEVVDSCHETVESVDSFSATSIIEQEILNENVTVAVQEVIQHVKELDTESEESQYKDLPSDLVQSKLSGVDEMIESRAQPPGVEAVMAKEQVFTKMDEDVKDVREQAIVQNQVVIPANTAVAVPQNTGIISSVGNIEGPSSLSLEFKLNIQFAQSKAPALLPQPTHITAEQTVSNPTPLPKVEPLVDRNEPAKRTEISEVGVQAVEEETKQENEAQKAEIVMAEAAVQATETIEVPDLMETLKNEETMDLGIQSAEIEEPINEIIPIDLSQNKSVLMDVGTQYIEIAEKSEEVKSEEVAIADKQPVLMDVGTQSIQQEETIKIKTTVEIPSIEIAVQPEQDIEEKGVLQTELVVLQVTKDQIKQSEDDDENQDIWMDAEEDIDAQIQRTMPLCEIEESFESEPDYFLETKTDFEESLENIKKIGLKCDIDSEGEDFAGAHEDPQIVTEIAKVEWD